MSPDIRPGGHVGYLTMAKPELAPYVSYEPLQLCYALVPSVAFGVVAHVHKCCCGVTLDDGQWVWGCCVRVPF